MVPFYLSSLFTLGQGSVLSPFFVSVSVSVSVSFLSSFFFFPFSLFFYVKFLLLGIPFSFPQSCLHLSSPNY